MSIFNLEAALRLLFVLVTYIVSAGVVAFPLLPVINHCEARTQVSAGWKRITWNSVEMVLRLAVFIAGIIITCCLLCYEPLAVFLETVIQDVVGMVRS